MTEWPREPLHANFRKALVELADKYFSGNLCETTLSRGLTILLPRRYPFDQFGAEASKVRHA